MFNAKRLKKSWLGASCVAVKDSILKVADYEFDGPAISVANHHRDLAEQGVKFICPDSEYDDFSFGAEAASFTLIESDNEKRALVEELEGRAETLSNEMPLRAMMPLG